MKRSYQALLIASIVHFTASFLLWASPASAELTFSFELSGKYEDNVTGIARDNPNIGVDTSHGGGQTIGGVHLKGGLDDILSGGTGTGAQALKQSDFSTTLYADIGAHRELAGKTTLLVLLSAEHTAYNKLTDLDFTVGTLSAGIAHRFSDGFSGRIDISAAIKDVKISGADSTVFGLTASLKEQAGESFWFRETATIEQSSAKSAVNDYSGANLSIRAGYDISKRTSLSAGYSYLQRDFKNSPVHAQTSVQAASVDWSMDLSDRWGLLAGYDHEWIKVKTDLASASAGNNVYSIGIRYDY